MNRREFLSRTAAAAVTTSASDAAAKPRDVFTPLAIGEARPAGLIGQRIELTARGNLLKLDIDKDFLEPFRQKQGKGDYVGAGKLLDSAVRIAAYTRDPALIALKERVAEGLTANQLADGYVGWYQPAFRIVKAWDIHEMGYIQYGLVSDYRLFGKRSSLDAARRVADHMIANLAGKLPGILQEPEIHPPMLMTGLDRAMLALHAATNVRRYLDFVVKDLDVPNWKLEIVEGRRPPYYGHAYAYTTRTLAQVELYHLTGDESLLSQSRREIDYLRRRGGWLITGSASKSECWHSDQSGDGELTETCATAYLIRLFDALLRMEGASIYGDMMERAIYNALFGAQSPDGRRLRYWTPFDGPRVYWPRDTYCCPCNFRRIIAELPQLVAYRWGNGLALNLYGASTVKTTLANGVECELHQESDYPNSGAVVLRVDPKRPAAFPLRLRVPRWSEGYRASVNNEPQPEPKNGWLEIKRRWRAGDRVEIDMGMTCRLVEGTRTQRGRVAVMRGPQVFTLNPKRNPDVAGADLKKLAISPLSFLPVKPDASLRPDGIACQVRATAIDPNRRGRDVTLTLTEFPDPDGEATYFLAPRTSKARADEIAEG
ncbi:MAG: glycoside hydrolase family 127 protein [Acidobacteriales bacterium]|nr:glycoside hydrolase family 127 protein [Terriglobales bacterium]